VARPGEWVRGHCLGLGEGGGGGERVHGVQVVVQGGQQG
jgi:hypothetical protein